MKSCTLLFTLKIQSMLRIDKVRARTLSESLILLQQKKQKKTVLVYRVSELGESGLL